MEETRKDRIIRMLEANVGVREICRIEGISNGPIYRVMKETGLRHKKIGKNHNKEVEGAVHVEEFVCPGIRHCVTCKHIFQHPCPLGEFSDA